MWRRISQSILKAGEFGAISSRIVMVRLNSWERFILESGGAGEKHFISGELHTAANTIMFPNCLSKLVAAAYPTEYELLTTYACKVPNMLVTMSLPVRVLM